MHSLSRTNKKTSLFEIRLNGTQYDVVIIKGPSSSAPSNLLTGTIVLSVLEPIHFKKLSLKISAILKLRWFDTYETINGEFKKPVYSQKTLYEHYLDNNYFLKNLQDYQKNSNLYSHSHSHSHSNLNLNSNSNSNSNSSTNLKNLNKKSKFSSFASSMSLSTLTSPFIFEPVNQPSSNPINFNSSNNSTSNNNLNNLNNDHHNNNTSFFLEKGNYEFPFSFVLPGTIPESVLGLKNAVLYYKIQSTLHKGKLSKDISATKHLRVIRTLTPDSLELAETMAVENTWPKKIEYSISIPSRAIAIGSAIPITLNLIPLLKGLKLSRIKFTLIEYIHLHSPNHSRNHERILVQNEIPEPKSHQYHDISTALIEPLSIEINQNFSNKLTLSNDRWSIDFLMQLPLSLSKITQDCHILDQLKVRHKLKFNIGLKNPDGHVSELRASLPVILFISPHVAISCKHDINENFTDFDDKLFKKNDHTTNSLKDSTDDQILFGDVLNPQKPIPFGTAIIAPPNYGEHVYDRLWCDVPTPNLCSPIESGSNSAAITPSGSNLNMASSSHNLSSSHLTRKLQNLRLEGERDNDNDKDNEREENTRVTNKRSGSQATFLLGSPIEENEHEGDYFSTNRHSIDVNNSIPVNLRSCSLPHSPGALENNSHSRFSSWTDLSKVPSYKTAIKSDQFEKILAPSYEESVRNRRSFSVSHTKKYTKNHHSFGSFNQLTSLMNSRKLPSSNKTSSILTIPNNLQPDIGIAHVLSNTSLGSDNSSKSDNSSSSNTSSSVANDSDRPSMEKQHSPAHTPTGPHGDPNPHPHIKTSNSLVNLSKNMFHLNKDKP
ncbi:arrestin C-terminal domain-containing protein ASCRUDRAFT_73657 [Ascoidea rubescens DSM 1968]|uniref:Arrestin C-terminal-like domain-containing protein n=1 Tax=Ascoidea rubescens DSM 1968 TaxID=1344418 RepID=A0A1D2VQS5_9ASCO|nr:hypothetical protein ASCRUDRAFT_73657 [Ascoidea rubescens DSM 1968]ODV63915.1 hypothetical protein ASCRUDRAFT_73657 [Ascoidea rubescens DSM 1968]